MTEQLRLLADRELEASYPGLRMAYERASNVTENHMRLVAPKMFISRPPLILDKKDVFQKDLALGSTPDTTAGGKHELGFAYFNPLDRRIYVSSEDLQDKLSEGANGIRLVTSVLAHERIHELTTVRTKEGIRTGFSMIKMNRLEIPKRLMEGDIYHREKDVGVFATKPSPRRVTTSEQADEFLDENTTIVSTFLMLEDMFPDLAEKYPYLILHSDDSKPSTVVRIGSLELLLPILLRSLLRDDRHTLRKLPPFPGGRNILEVLQTPGLAIVRSKNPHPSKMEDMLLM